MKIISRILCLSLSLAPLVGAAQSTVFHTTFGSDTINQASYTPTASSTNWDIASSKNSSSSSVSSSGLVLSMNSTSSGFVEAQTTFSNTGVTLSNVGDYITVTSVFTATNNIMIGGTGSWLAIGLYDSNGTKPTAGLANGGISTLNTTYATGGTAGWEGYSTNIRYDGGTSSISLRAAQTSGTPTSAAQSLSYSGNGGYNYPLGTTLAGGASSNALATAALTTGNTYTLSYKILLSAANTFTVSTNLYDGNSTAGTNLATLTGTTTGATYLTGATFDGLMIGERFSNTPGLASSMTITDVAITTNTVSAVPEPSTYAALAGLAALGLVVRRRRSMRQSATL